MKPPSHKYFYIKCALDWLICLVTLPITLPFVLIIAGLVRCGSKGPVFYRGVRSGKDGKPFRIYKFRSMVVDAEKLGGGTTALNDPRVTKVGAVLRRTKLDELPQIFNIMAGQMSFVGPRPELPAYTKLYKGREEIILSVKPGITDYSSLQFSDLASVVGADDADAVYETMVMPIKNSLRVKYVEDYSFRTDMNILFATLAKVILNKHG